MNLSIRLLLTCILALSATMAYSQEVIAYQLFDVNGKKVKYSKMIKDLEEADIIMFGELHTNAIAHWLQIETTIELHGRRDLILGAEMFEADNQYELNCYLKGEASAKELDTIARLWPNYKTDYKPLVDFAKDNDLTFVATNVPRRYAKMVYKGGFEALDTLSDLEKTWIAPLPIEFDPEIKSYKEILEMMGDHGTPELVKAQAIKDATMSHFIMSNYKENDLFIHYNGAYHSDDYEGILWYLKRANDDLNYKTISTVSQADPTALEDEYLGKADYIICVDSNMTETRGSAGR